MDIKNPTEQLRPVFNELFRFKIGDPVSVRAFFEKWKLEFSANPQLKTYERLNSPPIVIVLERTVHECHGGIQMQYKVSGTSDLNVVCPEFELVSLSEVEEALKNFRSKEDPPK